MTLRHKAEHCQSEGRVAQQGVGKRERLLKVKTRHGVERVVKGKEGIKY